MYRSKKSRTVTRKHHRSSSTATSAFHHNNVKTLGSLNGNNTIKRYNSHNISVSQPTRHIQYASKSRSSQAPLTKRSYSISYISDTKSNHQPLLNTHSSSSHQRPWSTLDQPSRRTLSSSASSDANPNAPPASPIATIHVPTRFENPDGPKLGMLRSAKVFLEDGKEYKYCVCGKSKDGVFCDGESHKGTKFEPLIFTVKSPRIYSICQCRYTLKPPFCDGEHKKFPGYVKPVRTPPPAPAPSLTKDDTLAAKIPTVDV